VAKVAARALLALDAARIAMIASLANGAWILVNGRHLEAVDA
jgi:hypothetical protein